ncbi:ribonuclease domain-containing protein [Nocardioides litoris]|uniref:ribonuclease domain-containing protein n=1 Tax=Nocardioides litoris TaxID=1926648 RepID=UPI001FE2C574|nr:ribonuclease domain-containing protein [Nocardioides litoris]
MVIHRVPPPKDGSRPRTSSAVAMLVVVAVAVAIWWVNGGDPGTSTSAGPGDYVTAQDGPPEATPSARGTDPDSGLPLVALADLPPEAGETVDLIDAGGPFPEDEDGSTFNNFEGLLPDRQRGYYAEYTVPTPGSRDRGARRIVAGDAGELYWTADHYASFDRIER